MAGGAALAPSASASKRQDYPGGLTLFVFRACMVAATGGLIFGYDIGISSGVTSMDPFLSRFFPSCTGMRQTRRTAANSTASSTAS
ncbi:unnamed protein product [Miscanthus lutarioriparius]|uniref:Uncharacterized protein n=1 Tax=Miscanthus lutarioriparius TaxID=422564 RepID=A0A811SDL9_9POAL|nr:unnamed protein product [Miscanthus lutarioriparius]